MNIKIKSNYYDHIIVWSLINPNIYCQQLLPYSKRNKYIREEDNPKELRKKSYIFNSSWFWGAFRIIFRDCRAPY